ncbi:Pecanex [Carpediemonas membranifera]|uniref:Pecanex n=1 Tax=Carpediemonas membranifera TaxID=201153 RepID=A0A8J6B5B5_9EUKA|nr:Pecanex [Carpediemonas membranifera]|eukprot:KAG9393344.1 Pecanex [Carpediemonas membranifera]
MLKGALTISALSWAYDTFLYIFGFERGSVLQLLTLVLHVALFPLSYFIFPQITILSGLIPFAFYYLPPLWRYRSSDTTQDVAHPTLDDISDAIGLKAQPRTFSMQEMVNARRNTTLSVIVAIHAAMMHLLTLVVASVVSLIVLTPWIASTIVRAVLFGIALVAAAMCCAARLLLEPTLFRLRSPLSPTLRAAISWVHTSLQYPVMLLTVCFITSYPVDPGVLSLVSYFFLSSHATFALTSPALALASAAPLLVPWGYTAPLALVLRLVLPRVSRVVRSVVLHAYYTVEPVAGNSKPAWRYICLAYVLLTLPLQLLGHVVAGVLGLDMFPLKGMPVLLPMFPAAADRLRVSAEYDPTPLASMYAVLSASLVSTVGAGITATRGLVPRALMTFAGQRVDCTVYSLALALRSRRAMIARAAEQTLLLVPRPSHPLFPQLSLHGLELAGTSCHSRETTLLDELMAGKRRGLPTDAVCPVGGVWCTWYSWSAFNADYYVSDTGMANGLRDLLPVTLGYVISRIKHDAGDVSERIADRIADVAAAVAGLPEKQRPQNPKWRQATRGIPGLTDADIVLVEAITHAVSASLGVHSLSSAWKGTVGPGSWLDPHMVSVWKPTTTTTTTTNVPTAHMLAPPPLGMPETADGVPKWPIPSPGQVTPALNLVHLETANALWPAALRIAVRVYIDQILSTFEPPSFDTWDESTTNNVINDIGEVYASCCTNPDTSRVWGHQLSRGVPDCFTLAQSATGSWSADRISGVNDQVSLATYDMQALGAIWDMTIADFVLGSGDDERYTIQSHAGLMRNLAVQAVPLPFGYPQFHAKEWNVDMPTFGEPMAMDDGSMDELLFVLRADEIVPVNHVV